MDSLIVRNRVIDKSIHDILFDLKKELQEKRIRKLKDIKPSTNAIMITCPNIEHKDANERKPSCGILTKATEKMSFGTCHCFGCGYTVPFTKFISNLFNIDDEGKFGEDWLLRNYISKYNVESRILPTLPLQRHKEISIKKNSYITEDELSKYMFYHPYMYKRRLTDDIIQKFNVGYDDHFELLNKSGKITNILKCLTFPVNDTKGNTLFIARRSVDTKFFHYPEGVTKPVYGLDKITKDMNTVIVCESFFNALTCWVYDKPAVALMGTGTPEQYEILKKSHIRKFILAFDGDDAGRRGDKEFRKALSNYKIITSYILPEGKDVNDLSYDEFKSLREYQN